MHSEFKSDMFLRNVKYSTGSLNFISCLFFHFSYFHLCFPILDTFDQCFKYALNNDDPSEIYIWFLEKFWFSNQKLT